MTYIGMSYFKIKLVKTEKGKTHNYLYKYALQL